MAGGVRPVAEADEAYRRVPPLLVVADPKADGGRRASSAAFTDDGDGSPMSVYLRSIVEELDLGPADVTDGKPVGWAVAAPPVRVLLTEEQAVEHDPVADGAPPHPCDPAHAVVRGDKKPKSRRERIARASPLVHLVV